MSATVKGNLHLVRKESLRGYDEVDIYIGMGNRNCKQNFDEEYFWNFKYYYEK